MIDYKTYNDLYLLLHKGDYTSISRRCGTNEYPEIDWMIEYFINKEEYEKCVFLQSIDMPLASEEKINTELEWLRINT